jgi:hypothetical protein
MWFVNRGEVHGDVDFKTAADAFKPGKLIGISVTGKLVGFPPYVVKVWLAALGALWHGVSPCSIARLRQQKGGCHGRTCRSEIVGISSISLPHMFPCL